ncbi:MAG: AAA family ATPase [Thermoplasmata archaeon]
MYRMIERVLIEEGGHKRVGQQPTLLLKALSDKRCLEILNIISVEPSYVGEIASRLRITESRVSEKVRTLKEAGMITEEWRRNGDRLVKYLKPSVRKIGISLDNGINFETTSSGSEVMYEYQYEETVIPSVANFVGRKNELNFLKRNPHVLIEGIPGIGKTTLAARFIRVNRRSTFWHEMRETDTLSDILARMASFLQKIGEDSLIKSLRTSRDRRLQANLAISGMRKSGTTLVFDDIHKCRDAEIISLIEDFLKSVPNVNVILISRSNIPLTSSSLKTLMLGELDAADARKLSGNRGASLAGRVGGHPLLLKISTNLPADRSVTSRSMSPEEYVSEVIFPSLPREIVKLITRLSFFRGAVNRDDAEFVLGKFSGDDLQLAEAIGLLKIRSGLIYVNDLIRGAAYKATENKREMHLKLSKFFTSRNGPGDLIEGFHHLWKSGMNKEMTSFLDDYGMGLIDSEYLNNFQRELLDASESMESCETKALLLFWAGRTYRNSRNYKRSLECFSKARICPHSTTLEVRMAQSEAVVLQYMGDLKHARDVLEDHVAVAKEIGGALEGDILGVLGRMLTYLGEIKKAEKVLKRMTQIFSNAKGSRGYCVSLINTAFMEYVRGNEGRAWEINEEAAACFLGLNSKYGYLASQQTRGFILESKGEMERAVESYSEAIEILESLGFSQSDMAFTLMKRSLASIKLGKLKEASRDIAKAKKIITPTGDELLKGMVDYVEGTFLLHKGRMREAKVKLENGMRYESGDPIFLWGARMEMARLLARNGKRGEAITLITGLINDLNDRGFFAFQSEVEETYKEICSETQT